MALLIFLDTNILYHILHATPRTDRVLALLEEHPGDYVIDTVVHNEIIYTSTARYLEHRYGVRGAYSVRRWIERHGYPEEVVNAVRELIKRLNMRLVLSIYTEQELYETMMRRRLLPSDAIIALTCRHYGVDTILTFPSSCELFKIPSSR